METFLGLCAIAIALYLGLDEIARAIRYRTIDVNVKLPPIQIIDPPVGGEH